MDALRSTRRIASRSAAGRATSIRPGGLGGFHIVSGPRINLDGDHATAEVMWTVIARDENDKPIVTLVGHHADELVREGGRWRFARRRGFMDIP
jgi:hypothetical protein